MSQKSTRGKDCLREMILTFPTVPIAFKYVQLLARGVPDQLCFLKEESNVTQGAHLPQMDMCSGGKTTMSPY